MKQIVAALAIAFFTMAQAPAPPTIRPPAPLPSNATNRQIISNQNAMLKYHEAWQAYYQAMLAYLHDRMLSK